MWSDTIQLKSLQCKGLLGVAAFAQLSRVDPNRDITHAGKRKTWGNKVNKRGGCAVIKTRTIRFAGKGIGNPADVYIDYVWSCKRELTAYGYAVDRISMKNRIVLFIRQEEAPALKHFGLRHGRQ